MPNQATTLVKQATSLRKLRALIGLVLVALAGCFGAPAMHYDIQEYNKQVVSSEKEMLLYNIGALRYRQPPHFMMLATISQSRTFSGSAGFKWANPATWAVPFTASGTENPTIQFVPIQGSDFAQRFESPVTDKFLYFLEDQRAYSSREEDVDLVMLFAQSLELTHGEPKGPCSRGLLRNDGYSTLLGCVNEIVATDPDYEQIDASHRVPTKQSEDPKAADLVTALQAGYKWTKSGDKFTLTTPVRLPAWFDYIPKFAGSSEPKKAESSMPVLWLEKQPNKLTWRGLQYTLPKGYQWKIYKTDSKDKDSGEVYALVPEGYDLDRYETGELKRDKNGKPILIEVKAEEPTEDVLFSYGDELVEDVWPVPEDYFYVELRKNNLRNVSDLVTDTTAERDCYDDPTADSTNDVVCGYLKIGNLLEIMRRLANMACTYPYQDKASIETHCSQSIFGIGSSIPPWADNSAPYERPTGPYVWVPAHNPKLYPDLAERDRKAFFDLYKLYQMSLVDTSKLVTGAPPITISK